MSRETQEYLGSLYNTDTDQGPQINWTRGFEGNTDQYNNYTHQQSDGNQTNSQGDNNRWDNSTATDDWNWND